MTTLAARRACIAGVFVSAMLLGIARPVASQQPSQAQANAIRQTCRGDYQTYCASVPTGGKAALECLQQNAASLSPPCQQAVNAVGSTVAPSRPAPGGPGVAGSPTLRPREEIALMRRACGADYRAYCRGERPGEGRAIACLRDNEASLSPGCQRALMRASQAR